MLDFKIKTYHLKDGYHVVCYTDPVTEKRKRRKFSSKADAKTYQQDLAAEFAHKGAPAFNETLVSQLMKLHLEKCPNSRVTERKNSFLSFCDEFGHRPINQVGKPEISQWFAKIKETQDYSDRTLCTIKSNLNSFFNFLVEENVLSVSPLSKIRFQRKPPPRRPRVALSVEEVHQLLEDALHCSPDVLYPVLFLAAYTGARRGEVIKLKRADVDLKLNMIHFRNTKNGEDRAIRISGKLRDFLAKHIATHDSEYAVPDPEGKMIGRQRLQRAVRRLKRHFPNGKNWGLHSLRHSFAYNFLKMGGNMYQLQAILGHKNIAVTVDTYGQLAAQDVKNACPYNN